mgnify:CR=1 FL=1|jgi:hypothetical protein
MVGDGTPTPLGAGFEEFVDSERFEKSKVSSLSSMSAPE